ncbi:unnamed protein product [Lota lota]
MKSSGAVFTREDPFPPLPIQKTWYHPSRRQNLTQKKGSKKTSGPGRPSQPANPLSTAEQRQQNALKRKPALTCPQTPADDQAAFQESWPSTDLESPSTETPFSSSMDTPGPSAGRQRHQQDSVLAKYVQRFRYGEPRSRAERHPVSPAGREEARPFWWMASSSPPSSPTPPHPGHTDDTAPLTEDRDPGSPGPLERRGELRTPRPHREPLDISALDLSDSSLGDRWDIEGVQERASRLLQKSESSVSSGSLVISSEGLGGSDLSSPVSVDEPVRRPFFPSVMESTVYNPSSASPAVGPSQKSYGPSSSLGRQRPEEDILFQWRLRRKMEQARHWPQSLSQQFPSLPQPPPALQSPSLPQPPPALQSPSLPQPPPALQSPSLPQPPPALQSPSLPQPSVMHGLCPPAAGPPPTSTPRPASSQTASSHQAAMEPLLWDGSPGPVRSSSPTTRPKALGRPPTHIAPKRPTPVLGTVTSRSPAQGVGEPERCPPPCSPESPRGGGSSETKPPQNERAANRKQKRCDAVPVPYPVELHAPWGGRGGGGGGDDALADCSLSCRRPAGDGRGRRTGGCSGPRPDRMAASTPQKMDEDKRQKDSHGLRREVCPARHAASAPPPVHRALRQAVSEALFPARVSSSSVTPPAPARPRAPDGNALNPEEVLSQLLREAEDSDGEEFEDDSLLQVLRKKRTWVKDQISQVDSLLEEFTQEGEVA